MDLRQTLHDALMEHTPDNVGETRVQRILEAVWPTLEPLVMSSTSRWNGEDEHRMTWREVAESRQAELERLRPLAQLLADLDRCEHGRHEGDHCWGCDGPSKGNPVMRVANGVGLDYVYALRDTGSSRTIGFRYDRSPIVVPPDDVPSNVADAWRAAS